MINDHPRSFWAMVACDVVFILIPLSLALIAAVVTIGYKTLWL